MKISQAKLILSLALSIFLLNACAGNETANTNSLASNVNSKTEVVAKDDIEELGKIIKLAFVPEEATYSEINLNDRNSVPNQKKLVAVLKFSAENANQIVAQAEKYNPPAPADIDAENWFPPELVAKSQETGDEFLKGAAYAANDFLQSPYINGRLTRINDTNYFVLELF
ncbi:MAG: hypothetical protein M3R14_10685 [Acidobacteriota bacterium]|nr:hypothetical protein [Acidobacteriota bacterium]